jgi:catechol 2,3-dioxygenase-like lactoylglutathione lyase family enzyme
MINGIHHLGITVASIERTARFYAQAANFQPAPQTEVALCISTGLGARALPSQSMLRSTNAYVRLLEPIKQIQHRPDRRPVAEAGIVHACLQSPSIEHLYGSFQKAGATFHAPPVDLGTGFLYSYARDNENNVMELEGVPPVWDDPTPWVAHVSLSSHDVDRLATFYANILGQTVAKSGHLGPHPNIDAVSGMSGTELRAAWIQAGNMQIEIIQYLQPATTRRLTTPSLVEYGYTYFCFEVLDATSALMRFTTMGATQSVEQAAMSDTHHAFCADPDGNIILLLQLTEAQSAHSIAALPNPAICSQMAARRTEIIKSNSMKVQSK